MPALPVWEQSCSVVVSAAAGLGGGRLRGGVVGLGGWVFFGEAGGEGAGVVVEVVEVAGGRWLVGSDDGVLAGSGVFGEEIGDAVCEDAEEADGGGEGEESFEHGVPPV
jgi:hypothetical protein